MQMVKSDFRYFVYLVYQHLKYTPTPVQFVLADYLQGHTLNPEGVPRRRIIEGFRGVAKSWLTSMLAIWWLLRDPEEKIMVISASKGRADEFSVFVKRLISEMPILYHLKPDKAKGHRDSYEKFDVGPCKASHSPSVKSIGVFGQMTGSRATKVILDDVEVPNNSQTEEMREKLIRTVMEVENIALPGAELIFLGTPQSEDSIYNKVRDNHGYTMFILPARYPEDPRKYKGNLASFIRENMKKNPKIAGEPIDPKRFNEKDLLEREASLGRSAFALQFMLDTSLSDAERYPLKCKDLMLTDIDIDKCPIEIAYGSRAADRLHDLHNPGFSGDRWYRPAFMNQDTWVPYEGRIMSVDPGGRGADETGYAVIFQNQGNLWVPDFGGYKGGYEDDVLEGLVRKAEYYKVNKIVVEQNFGGGMFSKLLLSTMKRLGYVCAVEEVHVHIRKEKRIIDTLEPLMNQHRLIFDIAAVEKDLIGLQTANPEDVYYSLFYQMTRITQDKDSVKHDDRVDALALGCAFWVDSMAKEKGQEKKRYEDRLMKKEIERYMDHVYQVDKPKKTRGSSIARKAREGLGKALSKVRRGRKR